MTKNIWFTGVVGGSQTGYFAPLHIYDLLTCARYCVRVCVEWPLRFVETLSEYLSLPETCLAGTRIEPVC